MLGVVLLFVKICDLDVLENFERRESPWVRVRFIYFVAGARNANMPVEETGWFQSTKPIFLELLCK